MGNLHGIDAVGIVGGGWAAGRGRTHENKVSTIS
jgi:hypothetical protein